VRSAFDVADDDEHREREPIAIIGMSGRFADSETLDAFWDHLAKGDDLVRQVTRWNAGDCALSHAQPYCSHGSFIDSIDRFDAGFFGISALEATYMDPQQRLFLEESWRALEDAGYAGKGVGEKQCGVYVGCGSSNYDKLSSDVDSPAQAFWGNSQAVTPARIAYTLNLQGPAIAIDTACSSSLVAIHLACQSLWSRETEMALAGGVFLQPTPGFWQVANRAGMLSADGKCYSFDARANGFVPGEGVGVVVLKRLRDAIADGDHIHGVIAASGINQDGKSNGLIAPNGRAQEKLERAVYERFDIDPETIQVLEAHGTGTLLGDSIEYNAITRAFRQATDKTQFCALGTVKTNIGHTSTAAGVAGVLKLLLALRNRQIPPSLHFEQGNPAIDLASGPFYVNTELRPWEPGRDQRRRAAISSFGFSGTNAHLILDEAPAMSREPIDAPAYLVVLSARSASQLQEQARNLLTHVEAQPALSMADVSFTLFSGRMHFSHRLACVVRDRDELVRRLTQWLETGAAPQLHTGEVQDGKVREQVSLKKFGNYCIEECRNSADATRWLENLSAAGELYVQGYALDYEVLFAGARRVPLPTYPFARERYWVDAKAAPVRRARRALSVTKRVALPAPVQTITPVSTSGDLRTWLQDELTQLAVSLLSVPASEIAADRVLVDLGFDSIGLTNFANAINQKFQLDLTPVVFFDYPSIQELARYLAAERANDVRRDSANAIVIEPMRREEVIEVAPSDLRDLDEPIAVVGIAGVMPQSEDLRALWEHLRNAKDLVTVIPEDRWHWEDYYGDPLKEPNKSNSKWGGFMKEVDKFDPLFFGISPREAQMMDPQQRIFLETVWKAIEDSGQKVSALSGTRTGVFVGVGSNDYIDILREEADILDGYTASGNSHSVLANRVSFLLNLRGPSAPIDTACSSSLVALHRAIESLRSGNCEMAIVGGVQVILSPGAYISFGMAGMLSGDGKCKTFDKRANGYVRGEGCGAMFLKPLSMAEADGNHIYAVIRSTSENHGGRVTTMTAPNSAAQAALLVEAYEKGGIDPSTVGYIECHGTGTSLGDPIEVQALSKAFGELYSRYGKAPAATPHCGLGTIKTNIGHLETAAGIAGALKVVLALEHKEIPANVHFEELNPYITLAGTPFYVVDKHTPWAALKASDGTPLPRIAGVSSFGFGGANAHAVFEEYIPPARAAHPAMQEPQLIVLSAKNADRLDDYVDSLLAHLDRAQDELIDIAWTLQTGRDEMPERLAIVASNREDLVQKLRAVRNRDHSDGTYRNHATNSGSVADIAGNDLRRVAEAWVSGATIDWSALHPAGVARLIPLPTYPFARERYWIASRKTKTPRVSRAEDQGVMQSLVPVWKSTTIHRTLIAEGSNVYVIGDDAQLAWVRKSFARAEASTAATMAKLRPSDQLLWIAPNAQTERLAEQQEGGVIAVFRTVKALLDAGIGHQSLQWTLITQNTQRVEPADAIDPAHAGIAGLAGSIAKEYPNWNLRVLDLEALTSVTAEECLSAPFDKQGNALAHRRGQWFQQSTAAVEAMRETAPLYRKNGVYVVIGGAGGLGEVWSRFMIEHYEARVVWIGRRPPDATIEAKLQSLTRDGNAPLYIAADATNPAALEQARESIVRTYGAIHGVVHSAIVLRDQSLARMDETAFRESLAAKVGISINIDRVFGALPLDFVLFFSSIVSFVKPAGQSNYAAGCAFKDAFAQWLQQHRPYPVKTVNWGYWGEIGVAADDVHRRNMARMGLGSIHESEGMAALQAFMSSDLRQLAVVKATQPATTEAAPRPAATIASAAPIDTVRKAILEQLSAELHIDAAIVDLNTMLTDYGVDSIVGVNLVRRINEALQIALDPASLFEHSTVRRLVDHIVAQWPEQFTAAADQEPIVTAPRIHPLLHTNTSTLRQQSYSATFAGDESFVENGVVAAPLFLEMARAAVERAADAPKGSLIELRNIVWGEPLTVTSQRDVTIALVPGDSNDIQYEIYSNAGIHCQGRATVASAPAPVRFGLEALQGQLVRLSAPLESGVALPASILNGALKAAVNLVAGDVPVAALQHLRVIAPCKAEMYAWARLAEEDERIGIDVDLLDADGTVCVQMRGVSVRIEESAGPRTWLFSTKKQFAAGINGQQALELFLRQEAAMQLQKMIDDVPADRSYFDLGFTSPAITQFVQSLNRLVGEELSPTVLFDHRDIRSLAAHLIRQYPASAAALTAIPHDRVPAAARPVLTPLPRKSWLRDPEPAAPQGEQLLEELLWQDASLDDRYEKVTF
jgi:acyl transferase domain-containing protein